ncbi:autoinducer binding domain-containing protein [Pleomorphomonas sp. PLEO]|uniref:helix-turn-helix transcriptional regulator n=1 Tax=Pleomorphomonas sp. PLEO TaxID=3239306 RepID=UPI00351F77E4
MPVDIAAIKERLATETNLEGCIDQAFDMMKGFGFDALIYDYTPVPYDVDGSMNIPSVLKLRNVPEDMHEYWCGRGYFRFDPVQQLALRTSTPFFWNYDRDANTAIRKYLCDDSRPVESYLRDRGLTSGVTVPVHLPRGDYATVTGVSFGAGTDFQRTAEGALADFGLLAHLFHETAYSAFDAPARIGAMPRLTDRERECLRHSAEGLSAKEISRIIDRSVPTVVMHLNSAIRKLGARNRTQAVVRAIHYRLLDERHTYNF